MNSSLDRIAPITRRLRRTAEETGLKVDVDVYRAAGRDPLEPVLLGSGSLSARLGIFGRDPGATEIALGEPFIGAGGRLVRRALLEASGERQPDDDPRLRGVGSKVFWANTVPYKPVGNKAWGVGVRRSFRAPIASLVAEYWSGHDLITLGNNAFFWFGLDDRDTMTRLTEYWQRPDRYESRIEVYVGGKHINLYPLPHPSPLNARYFREFPRMMRARLQETDWAGE